jgi:Mn2+/Fe2+ NRAMP family transporter
MARLAWDFQTPKTENQTGIKMKEKISIGVVFYVGVMISAIVSVDLLFFKHRFWERLIVNIGISLVFAAFYSRYLKKQ